MIVHCLCHSANTTKTTLFQRCGDFMSNCTRHIIHLNLLHRLLKDIVKLTCCFLLVHLKHIPAYGIHGQGNHFANIII